MTEQLPNTAERHSLTMEKRIEELDPDGKLRQLASAGDIEKLDVADQMKLLRCIAKDPPTDLDDFDGDRNAMLTDFFLAVIEGAFLYGLQEEEATSHVQKSRTACLPALRTLRGTLRAHGRKQMLSHVRSMALGFGVAIPTIEDQKKKAARTNVERLELIAQLCQAGHSNQQIAMILNSKGILNLHGRPYTKDAIKRYRSEHKLKKGGTTE